MQRFARVLPSRVATHLLREKDSDSLVCEEGVDEAACRRRDALPPGFPVMTAALDPNRCIGEPPKAINGHAGCEHYQQQLAYAVAKIFKRTCQVLGSAR